MLSFEGSGLIDEAQKMNIASVSAPSLINGCYLLDLTTPSALTETGRAVGTLRVDWTNAMLSGDLYEFPLDAELFPPDGGVPAFEDSAYLGHLRGLRAEDQGGSPGSLRIQLELQWLDRKSMRWTTLQDPLVLVVEQVAAPAGWSEGADYRAGDVEGGNGGSIGKVELGRISYLFRKALVEIANAPSTPVPLNNGAGVDWSLVFDKVGWKVETKVLAKAFGSHGAKYEWTVAELHEEMLTLQKQQDGPRGWIYFLACVSRIQDVDRGVLFDVGAVDTDNLPRQGVAIVSGWPLEQSERWAKVRENGAETFGEAPLLYFRTAVHEIGHAAGLGHSKKNNFLMNTTLRLAKRSAAFPDNVLFEFRQLDEIRLRHWPDPYVRPGGVAVPNADQLDGEQVRDKDLSLKVLPLIARVPLGAPVRIRFVVRNEGENSVSLPSLSLKGDHVSGRVSGVGGPRGFRPMILRLDEDETIKLEPGESRGHWITLLRGSQGALFPAPGKYKVEVRLRRNLDDGSTAVAVGTCEVEVTSEEAYVSAAQKVLETPDTLLVLALGGDHLQDGLTAMKTALANKVLKPHFAVVEAKRRARLAQRLDGIWRYLSEETVMSGAELLRIAEAVVWRRGVQARLKKVLEPHVAKLEDIHPGIGRELDEVLASGRVPRRILARVSKK